MKKIYLLIVATLTMALCTPAVLFSQWHQATMPYSNLKVYALASNSSYMFAGTYYSGVFRSSDGGTNWTSVSNGLSSNNIYGLAVIGSNLLAGTDAGVNLSTDNGSTWSLLGLSVRTVYSFLSRGGNLFAGTDNCVYLSTDNGSNWAPQYSAPTYDDALLQIGSTLFAGSQFNGVYGTIDDGSHWISSNTGLTNLKVFALAQSPNGTCFAGTNSGMFRSLDTCAHWTAADSGLTAHIFLALAAHGADLFAGSGGFNSNTNIFCSTNNGVSWNSVSDGLSSITNVYSLTAVDSLLVAGTDKGVWKRPLVQVGTGVNEKTGQVPAIAALGQNYPNPFNPATVLPYQLPRLGRVSIRVFDVLGREVAVLVNEEKPAGSYQATWNASGNASGLYFYRLDAGTYSQTKKMLLVR